MIETDSKDGENCLSPITRLGISWVQANVNLKTKCTTEIDQPKVGKNE